MADRRPTSTVSGPLQRSASRLSRLSFAEPTVAAETLANDPLRWWDVERVGPVNDAAAIVIAALGRCADPDAALATLASMVTGDPELRAAVCADASLRARLLGLLGVSLELGTHLRTHPRDWRVLVGPLDPDGVAARLAAASDPAGPDTVAGVRATGAADVAMIESLRGAYRRELIAIAGRDLASDLDLQTVTELLADLATKTLHAVLTLSVSQQPDDAPPCRLAVIAMGKTGARELNYVSDVDVVFVGEGRTADEDIEAALATASRLASDMIITGRAVAWEVDANLRPEGRDGALVRTLASHEAYYRRWASTWEFQALLKARPVAGDLELGEGYRQVVTPLVWTAAERPNFVTDVRAMRRRVVEHIPAAVGERDIKLGPGGLRDVEFAVQLLQLVHGRGDDSLRVAATLPALVALRDGGYIGRDDATSLIDAYRFLRAVEHRLQLRLMRRTHLLPDDPEQMAWLAKAMGFRPDHRGDARAVFRAEFDLHSREVRRLHEKLFYRPLLEAVAQVPAAGLRLTAAEAGRRLAALGFADPTSALRHIEALTNGLTRRAALQRALLPVLLADFADAPDPDAALLAYRRISDELDRTPWYLRLLRDGDAVVSQLAYVLGVSRYVPRMLARTPEALRMLADPAQLVPRPREQLTAAMIDSSHRQNTPAAAVAAVRGVRRQELLRVAFADLLAGLDVDTVCESLSAVMAATLESGLDVACRSLADERGVARLPIRFAIIAMGRLGGAEIGYGSDADVMFVFENAAESPVESPASAVSAVSAVSDVDDETAARIAHELATRLRELLGSASATDAPLIIDAGLRPEGRSGPLVRSLASYQTYYRRWSAPWEAQALLRARPIAGDADLGARFVAMIDPVRYPEGGVSGEDLLEIRRLKGRIDAERLPRGADPTTHTKLGRGGLADIEWTVQLLQLQHGSAVAGLRTPRTLDALSAAAAAGLLGTDQAEVLAASWRLATRVRNAARLVRDKEGDQVPAMGSELAAVARVLGYPMGGDPGRLVDDYRRAARRARKVVESVFYGS